MTSQTNLTFHVLEQQKLRRSGSNFSSVLLEVCREPAPSTSRPLSIQGIVLLGLSTIIPGNHRSFCFFTESVDQHRESGQSVCVLVLQLIIGYQYVGQCPVNEKIPRYLIVIGILGIILSVLRCSRNIIGTKVVSKAVQPVPQMMFYILTCSIVVLLIFLLAWLVGGYYWVFRSWDLVQYDFANQGDYCHPFLYRFAYWIWLLTVLVNTLACFQPSARLPLQLRNLRNAYARILIPTTKL